MHTVLGSNHSDATPDPLADDPALWDLLDRAVPPPKPGPFLTRRVLREVATFEAERAVPVWRRLGELFATRPRIAWSGASFAAAGAAMLLAVGTMGRWAVPFAPHHFAPAAVTEGKSMVEPADLPQGEVRESDIHIIADLEELTDTDENHVWLNEDDESGS